MNILYVMMNVYGSDGFDTFLSCFMFAEMNKYWFIVLQLEMGSRSRNLTENREIREIDVSRCSHFSAEN